MKNEYYLLSAGLLGVLIATSLSIIFENVWVGFITGFVISVAYLFMLDKQKVRRFHNEGTKKIIRYLFASLVFLQLFVLSYDMLRSNQQHNNLMIIRTTIENTLAQLETEQTLIKALRHYHHEAEKDNRTIASSFHAVTGDRLLEDGTLEASENLSSLSFFVTIHHSDSLQLNIISDGAHGLNPEFKNNNTDIGKYQAIATLTPKGVSYEREN